MRLFLIIYCLCILGISSAQEIGKPFITNFPPKIYKGTPQNWSVIQDSRGLMYFGNTNLGILEFDGVEWRNIYGSKNEAVSTVRSFDKDKHGVIYYGAKSDFGALLPDGNGGLEFSSFLPLVKEKDKNFADVFKTYATPNGIFFQSFQALFLWKNGSYEIFYPSENTTFHLSFYVGEKLYIRERGKGLLVYSSGKLIPVKGGEAFAEERIFSMLPYNDGKILVGTHTQGLFIFDPVAETFSRDDKFKDVESFIIPNTLYHGIVLSDGNYLYSTFNGGSVIFSSDGKIQRYINKYFGLQDETVHYAYQDRNDNIWLALANGISFAEISSPFSYWDESTGLKGTVSSVTRSNGKIYAATNSGVFCLVGNSFIQVEGINTPAMSLLNFKISENGKNIEVLLAGTNTGIFEIKENKARLVSPTYTFTLCQSAKNPNRVFAGLSDGVSSLLYNGKSWSDEGRIKKTYKVKGETKIIDKPIKSIAESKNGELWLGTEMNGVYRIKFLTDEKFSRVDFPYITQLDSVVQETGSTTTMLRFARPYSINGNMVIFCQKGTYVFNDVKKEFEEYKLTESSHSNGAYLFESANEAAYVCYYSDNNEQWIEKLDLRNNKSDSLTFKRIRGLFFESIFAEPNGVVWFACNNGIYRFDSRVKKKYSFTESALVRKLSYEKEYLNSNLAITDGDRDTIVFWGSFQSSIDESSSVKFIASSEQPASLTPVYPYSSNSPTIYFSYPFYEDVNALQFSFYLEGFDAKDKWSDWKKETKKDYTNLDPGVYVFHVKAKNIFGTISKEATFRFEILPPWYRTIWAYIIYAILFVALVYVLVKINTYRLLKEKERLEKIVKERTAEVVMQKEEIEGQRDQLVELNAELQQQKEEIEAQRDEIEHQRDEIVEQKKEITDSIHYAKRIQTAILPPEEYVTKSFPDHFILFKPRDIVSGDFYWSKYFPSYIHTEDGIAPNLEETTAKGTLLFCVADCTGHGVPGAFMSMLGTAFLNEIANTYSLETVKQNINAAEILNKLRNLIIKSLHQTGKTGEQKDGMDITFCILDLDFTVNEETSERNYELQYAGANNSLYVIRKAKYLSSEGDKLDAIEEVDPDKMPIGIYLEEMKPFTNNIVKLVSGDMIFLTTDGYADQFGGPKGKKFMYKPMKRLFLEIYEKPTSEQKEILNTTNDNWRGDLMQVDDITVMGLKL